MQTAAGTIDPPLPEETNEQQPVPRTGRVTLALIALGVCIGGLFRFAGPRWLERLFQPLDLTDPKQFGSCLMALALAIAVHEVGHLAAAMLLDFEVTGVSLGPLRWSRVDGKWTVQIQGQRLLKACVIATPRGHLNWRSRMLKVIGAGPLATCAACCASGALALSTAQPALSNFSRAFVQLNLLLFLLGLIPSRRGAPPNDARLFTALWRFDTDARGILLYHLITQFKLQGLRPRQYPEWVIRRLAVAQVTPAMHSVFAQVIADWALDRGDLDSANAWNDHLADSPDCDTPVKNVALAHSACLDIVLRDDVRSAGQKLSCVDLNAVKPKYFRHRCLAANALAHGDVVNALGELCRAEFFFPARNSPLFGYEQLLLTRFRQVAREVARTCPPAPKLTASAESHPK